MCKAIENLKRKYRSDGFDSGFNNGLNNGILKEKESIALKMLQEEFDLDTICHLTELPIATLIQLQAH